MQPGPSILDKISGGKELKGILVSPFRGLGGAVAEHSISIPNKLFPCTRGGPRFSCYKALKGSIMFLRASKGP